MAANGKKKCHMVVTYIRVLSRILSLGRKIHKSNGGCGSAGMPPEVFNLSLLSHFEAF